MRKRLEPEWVARRRERIDNLDLEIEQRRRRLAELEERERALDLKRRRSPKWLSNLVIATGLSASAIAFGGKVAEDYYFGDEGEVCREAYEVMRDERPNEKVPATYMTPYLEKQARNAIICANRKLD